MNDYDELNLAYDGMLPCSVVFVLFIGIPLFVGWLQQGGL